MPAEPPVQDRADVDLSPREEEIVRSAYRVIAAKGAHRLSLQDIADDAGVSKGLLLYHFTSKDRLFAVTMRWALVGTARRIRQRLAATDGAEDAISAVVNAIFVAPGKNRDYTLMYLDLIEHGVRVESFGSVAVTARQIINGLFEEVIAEGVDAGTFDVGDVAVAASQMRALIEGTFLAWLQDDWGGTHDRYRDQCEAGLRRLLGADPPRSRASAAVPPA